MARKKRGSGGESGGNWMDTYGDMVTLLLTFFIMLYATSTPDEVKWQQILQAFQSKGSTVNLVVDKDNDTASEEPYTDDVLSDNELPASFDELYHYLVNYVEQSPHSESIEVSKGVSNIYLKFRDNVFFNGDSHYLLATGQEILSDISVGISEVEDKILGVKVSGHTAVAEFSSADDFTLSSMRAVNVANYIEKLDIMPKEKMSTAGYGASRPVAPNDTEENRSQNRRVEMIIFRNDVDLTDPEVIDEFLREMMGASYVTPEGYLPEEMPISNDTTDVENGTDDITDVDNVDDVNDVDGNLANDNEIENNELSE